jgi:hypothetical protein
MRPFHFLASEEHKEDIQASSVVKLSPPHPSEFHYEMRHFHFLASEEHNEEIQASSVVESSPPHFTYLPSVVNQQNT